MIQKWKNFTWPKPGHRMHLALKKLKVTVSSWIPDRRTVLRIRRSNAKGKWSNMIVPSKTLIAIPIVWKSRDTMSCTWAAKVSFPSNSTPKISRFGQTSIGSTYLKKRPQNRELTFAGFQHHATMIATLVNPTQISVDGEQAYQQLPGGWSWLRQVFQKNKHLKFIE